MTRYHQTQGRINEAGLLEWNVIRWLRCHGDKVGSDSRRKLPERVLRMTDSHNNENHFESRKDSGRILSFLQSCRCCGSRGMLGVDGSR